MKRALSAAALFLLSLFLLLSPGQKSGSIPDGIYEEPYFSFSGGSGKVTLSCEKFIMDKGQGTAYITFSSPHFSYVISDGVRYEGTYTPDTSTFVISAEPDREMKIIGCTLAMSKPHEIEYTILISPGKPREKSSETPGEEEFTASDTDTPIMIEGLSLSGKMALKYAECFDVHYYKDEETGTHDYKVISVIDGNRYLIPDNGSPVPKDLPADLKVISSSDRIYLAATSAMSLFNALDSLDRIRFSGTDKEGWYIEEAVRAMEEGRIIYAGKYSAPDYELLLSEGADLAVESTMILHSPEVRESLNKLGITVFTDYSSYEGRAFGRMEWIKAYGAILGKEEEAEAFFEDRISAFENSLDFRNTGKKTAFFYVNNAGLAVVRKKKDYIADLIRMGGGEYAFDRIDGKTGESATVPVSMETLYDMAKDSDFIIYDNTIDPSVRTVEDLTAKNPLFSSFKAVKEGNVYITDGKMYQSTDRISEFALDVNRMLTGSGDEDMVFISKLG